MSGGRNPKGRTLARNPNKKKRVVLPIPENVRAWIYRTFKPQHPDFYARWVTHAYGFRGDDIPEYPKGVQDVQVLGVYRGKNADALIVSVNGEDRRPDGALYHITLSVAAGERPADSWRDIDPSNIEPVKGVRPFKQFFRVEPAMQDKPGDPNFA
jgi:hypothetical protein